MPVRTAKSVWRGDLKSGDGTVALGSGAFEGPYSFPSRFEEGAGTNPEELIGAALAGCYAMALANALAGAGFDPTEVRADARVHLGKTDGGMSITKIELVCRAVVPDLDAEVFATHANATKSGCIVARALAAVPIELDAALD